MNFKKLTLYSSVFAIQALSNAVIPVLPELTGGSSSSAISNLLFSGYFMGAFLAFVPFGILADRIGNLKVIAFGILLTAISGMFIFFSENLWILVLFRFLEGIGSGSFFPAAFSLIAEWKDSRQSLGEFNFLLNAGLASGVFFSGILAGLGIKTAIGIFTFFAVLSCVFLLSGVKELLFLEVRRKELNPSKNGGNIEDPSNVSLFSEIVQYFKKARKTVLKSVFWKIWGISVLLYGATGLLTANYPEYSAGFLTKPELGFAISASYLAAMLSSLMAGRMNMNPENIVRAGILIAVAGIFLSVSFPILAFSLMGAGGGIAIVGLIVAVSRISSSGFAMGLFNTGIYAGLGLGPIFGSFFLEPFGYETVFLGSGVLLFTISFVKLE
jgi:MFS family permease